MWSRSKSLVAAGLLLCLCWLLQSCNVGGEGGRTYLDIRYDTAWTAYDTLRITWIDSATGRGGLLFEGKPSELERDGKRPADGYQGGKISITVEGRKAGGAIHREVIHFDGAAPENPKVDIIVLTPPGKAGPPVLTFMEKDTSITIRDTLVFTASASLDSGELKSYSWDFNGDGLADRQGSLSGQSGSIPGAHGYPLAGRYQVVLTVTSESDSSAQAQVIVHVKQDVPVADAGVDTTVYVGTAARLRGKETDTLGQIVSRQWKIGGGNFEEAPLAHAFTAPAAAAEVICLLRVTDDDGQSDTDTVVVHVVSPTVSNLTALETSQGAVHPAFSPGDTIYSDTVAYAVESLTVTAWGNGALTANGLPLVSGQASTPFTLKTGDNPIAVTVQVTGAAAKTYRLNIVRLGVSANRDLSALAVSMGRLSPDFAPGDTVYSVTLAHSIASVTVTPTVASTAATVTVQGKTVASGAASGTIDLAEGDTQVAVTVTAQNGGKKTYTIRFIRALATAPLLSALSVSAGALDTAFSPADTVYRVHVANGVIQTTVTPTTAAATSSVTVNGNPVVSTTASGTVFLAVGTTRISIVVTSESGHSRLYQVDVIRAANDDATLSGLTVSSGALDTQFSPDDTLYLVSVGSAVASIRVTPTQNHSAATITVDGQSLPTGSGMQIADLKLGMTEIVIVVTAESGVTRTYRVQVTRARNGNATLAGLTLSAGNLVPDFTSGDTVYAFTVAASVNSTTVTPLVSEPTATVTVNGSTVGSGSASTPITLATGPTPIAVVVTAENGAKRTYSVTVTRRPSDIATLSDLSLTATGPGGTAGLLLSPVFASDSLTYNATRTRGAVAVKVTPTALNAQATIKVNNVTVASGLESGAINLSATSATTLSVVVTAEDGSTVRSYSIRVALPTEIGFVTGPGGTVYRTFNGGVDWSPLTPITPGRTNYSLFFLDAKTGYTAAFNNLIDRTIDGGRTWQAQTTEINNNGLDCITFTNATTGYAVGGAGSLGSPGTILKTVNGGAEWVASSHPGAGLLHSVHFPTETKGYAVGIGSQVEGSTWGTLIKTSDAGNSWTVMPSPTTSYLNSVFFTDSSTGYVAGNEGTLLKTVNGGTTWTPQASGNTVYLTSIFFVDANIGYTVGAQGYIAKTTNGGATWLPQSSGTTKTLKSVYFTDANSGYAVGLDGVILKTVNGGTTWVLQRNFTSEWFYSVQFLK